MSDRKSIFSQMQEQESSEWLEVALGQRKEVSFARNRLSMAHCQQIGQELASNITLELLNLHQTKIGDDGVKHICEGLAANDTLKDLYLGGCKLTDRGATYLADALKRNFCLDTLNIQFNQVGEVKHYEFSL